MPSYINFGITALPPSCHYLHDISAESPGRAFTKEQIYSAGWNDDYAVDDNAIRVMFSKLREKRSIILSLLRWYNHFSYDCGTGAESERWQNVRISMEKGEWIFCTVCKIR